MGGETNMELTITNLSKDFGGQIAVDGFSCTLTYGVYGLLGVNGAGKTTLMRMITTLLQPSAGEIRWNGSDIFRMGSAYRDLLGYLPQEFGFYPEFTIQEYLYYIASLKGIRPGDAKAIVAERLSQVGLTKARNKKMKKLSGGMKRRVGIAQAMLNDPQILILDEPTAGLDPNERIRFRNLLSELSADRIVLISTHIVSDIENIAGEILLMKDGKIRCSGTSEALIAAVPVGVWQISVPPQQAKQYQERFLVSNVKQVPGGLNLRVLSAQKPTADAIREETTLEDVFLYYFGERGAAENEI